MDIKPIKDFVLIKEPKKVEVSAGGIVLANGASTGDTKKGIVEAIGPDVEYVSVGDVVYLDWSMGKTLKIGDTDDDYRMSIKEEFIMAVLDK